MLGEQRVKQLPQTLLSASLLLTMYRNIYQLDDPKQLHHFPKLNITRDGMEL